MFEPQESNRIVRFNPSQDPARLYQVSLFVGDHDDDAQWNLSWVGSDAHEIDRQLPPLARILLYRYFRVYNSLHLH